MPLLRANDLHHAFGDHALLVGVNLTIEQGECTCLVGRNGCGKSTLLKILAQQITPDDGTIEYSDNLKLTSLEQEIPSDLNDSVYDVIAGGLGPIGKLLSRYHRVISSSTPLDSNALIKAQHELDSHDGWVIDHRIEKVASRFSLDVEGQFSELSGGMKRRALLARALVVEPDLLLLDEPTNHLDIDSIEWLQDFLVDFRGTVLFITHDRTLAEKIATRILHLDRGKLTDWPGDFKNYLRRREALFMAEEQAQARFDKKLAEEEVWIRKGVQARRKRNQGRVNKLFELRDQRRLRRDRPGSAKMQLQEGNQHSRLFVECLNSGYAWGDNVIFKEMSILIQRGDRVGIIGPNGIGKSTLLGVLTGAFPPTSGKVRTGANIELAYFDQLRTQLDEEKTVQENIGRGIDHVTINGKTRHVISYLQDFLFTPQRARSPVSSLSGGERNRLLLAMLFARPANALVLDEPTNDLDIETLELLEELILDYRGTLLLVSHDRRFLDNTVTSTLVFDQPEKVNEYVGGYEDWIRQRPALPPIGKPQSSSPKHSRPRLKQPSKKLSYIDQRELDALPGHINELENEQSLLQERLADPEFYQHSDNKVSETTSRLAEVDDKLNLAYSRWEELESISDNA